MGGKLAAARRENWRFAIGIFALGLTVGCALAGLYLAYSGTVDRYFHAFIMWAGAGITFPLFSISIRIMLKMYYKALEQEERFAELAATVHEKEQRIEPIIKRVEGAVNTAVPAVEQAAKVVERVTANGKLEAALQAVADIPAKLDKLVARPTTKGGPVDVPVIQQKQEEVSL